MSHLLLPAPASDPCIVRHLTNGEPLYRMAAYEILDRFSEFSEKQCLHINFRMWHDLGPIRIDTMRRVAAEFTAKEQARRERLTGQRGQALDRIHQRKVVVLAYLETRKLRVSENMREAA